MNVELLIGLQAACFVMLAALLISLFTDKWQNAYTNTLLCAAVLLLASAALGTGFRVRVLSGMEREFQVLGILSTGLALAACAALAVFFFRWKPGKTAGRAAAWLSALLWALFLAWVTVREAALLPVAGTFSLLTAVLFQQRTIEENLKRRAEEIENRQAVLFQWQMQPHFIFNTMNTIRELMTSKPSMAVTALDCLADYLRTNLDALSMSQMIPFERELAHIEQYVMLEKMNTASLFDVAYDLQILDFSIPALSVQPLVENAIRHGVRSMDGRGMVFVTTEEHGEMIRIVVEDNGHGFARDATEQQKNHISHGIENVRRRLETQCGGTLHMRSGEGGTRMIILIPREK